MTTTSNTVQLLLVTLTIFTITHTITCQSIGRCGPDDSQKFDDIVTLITILGKVNGSFPASMIEVNRWCADAKESVKGMRDFSKRCLDSVSKQVSNLIAYGVSKHHRKVCRNNKTKNEAASKLRCLNVNYPNLNKQMAMYVEDYQRTINLEYKKKLAGLCCGFHSFAERVKTEAKKVCSSDNVQYFSEFVKAFSSDALDLLCSQHTIGSESCRKLVLPEKPSNMTVAKSFLPPLLVSLSAI